MMHDVALGVEQLTHAGVIWIDGKPENVLVDRKPAGGFAVKVSGEGGQQGGGDEAAERRTGEAGRGSALKFEKKIRGVGACASAQSAPPSLSPSLRGMFDP